MDRRNFLQQQAVTGILLCSTSLSSGVVFGQEHLSIEQKENFSRVFGVSRDFLDRLQSAQDTRIAVFSNRRSIRSRLDTMIFSTTSEAEITFTYFEWWHNLSLTLTAVDHASRGSDDLDLYGEQLGPTRSSWALALIHLAMFEALNTYRREYESFKPLTSEKTLQQQIFFTTHLSPDSLEIQKGSLPTAITFAALTIMDAIYPKKTEFIRLNSKEKVDKLRGDGFAIGKVIGEAAGDVVLKSRGWIKGVGFADGTETPDPKVEIFTSNDFRKWQRDPITQIDTALGALWWRVAPFVVPKADSFRCSPPPAFDSEEFKDAFKDVNRLGGWGVKGTVADPASSRWPTATERVGDPEPAAPEDAVGNESFKAIFWAYDGTAYLCAPPRLYLSIATTVARKKLAMTDPYEFARLTAVVAMTMADAAICAWEAKYFYLHPRPITYIRKFDADDSEWGQGNPNWTPLGAAATNAGPNGRNLTPPFPAYPSGHAVFGGAVFEILRLFMIKQSVKDPSFEFVSDEYNGENYAAGSMNPRINVKVEFPGMSEPEEENGQSRIWMGIHWRHDKIAGQKQGNEIGKYVFNRLFLRTDSAL